MKTGYDKHFKKVKQSASAPAFNVRLQKGNPAAAPVKKARKSSFPVKPLMSFILLAAGGLLFLENTEAIENYLKKIEISMGTAQAEEKKPEAKPAVAAPVVNADSKTLSVEGKKLEDAEYMFKLAERKKQLDQRENDLNKLSEQIEKQKVEITEKLTKLEATRLQISKALEEKIKADDGKVETLVQMYTNMKFA